MSADYEINVPYIQQESPTTCWKASYKMMLRWAGKSEMVADQLPNDKEMQVRGIYDSEFPVCQRKLGLRTATADQVSTPEGLQAILYEFGPIWCGGYYCPDLTTKLGRGFKHIVVIRGVKTHWFDSPEVYVNDPYRGYVAQARPSWWSWSYFYSNLLKVPNNCQYWE